MSDFVVLDRVPGTTQEKTAAKSRGIGATLRALMESLVDAQRGNYEGAERIFYRYPPV